MTDIPTKIIGTLDGNQVVPMTEIEIAIYNADLTEGNARRAQLALDERTLGDARSSGIAHALSLDFTQAQAEAMFP